MPNRLARETSPYLLQHRDNPVDWYPWGEEALRRAREEDRPILLSVGYSACHWCHVMEHESFEDETTARLMNESFVSIKVDREERPDIDSIYMNAVQQMTGHGGWPMTVFLTPEGVPFYGGTYFPPEPRHGLPSFRQVLVGISEAYRSKRDDVTRNAEEIRQILEQGSAMRLPPTELDSVILGQSYRAMASRYEPRAGGFGNAPKFPQPMSLAFLLRYWRRTGEVDALAMLEHTLQKMARGGMYDQLGGGFHRYSVDARWLVPHFEKMLYDNALLSRLYLHAFLATGKAEYRRVAEEVLGYVLREMHSPEGGFYSTQDADSEGVEGKFYVWSAAEVDALLGPHEGPLFRRYYDVTEGGNFEGKNILHVEREAEAVAAASGVKEAELAEVLERGRRALYEARSARVWPGRDEKVLTAWNAMMVRSLADAGFALDHAGYRDAARAGADFLLGTLRPQGRLLRSYKDGIAKIDAFLEDHALLVDALVSLYEATFEGRWLTEARALADTMLERFWEPGDGVFYDTATDGERLLVRPRDVNDTATPSGTSSATVALLRLAALTGEDRYRAVAAQSLEGLAAFLPQIPLGFGEMLAALDTYLARAQEVVVVGSPGEADTDAMLGVLRRRYLPNAVWALREKGMAEPDAAGVSPLLAQREALGGRATAYVCEHFACLQPVTDPGQLEAELR
jgi:uncharacterized protein YyaL (SSP411 family)